MPAFFHTRRANAAAYQDTATAMARAIHVGIIEIMIEVWAAATIEHQARCENVGSPGRIRTSDHSINSRMLYH